MAHHPHELPARLRSLLEDIDRLCADAEAETEKLRRALGRHGPHARRPGRQGSETPAPRAEDASA